ncbi:MAG TPA: aminotransferase class V-fold PLP-dependent enzyme [Syntrophorhabdaceae bacterium]|mgnify:CR=1 FL=1|nr:aminotransferase class V-fold PLP-dependent enzyme [Syntrophorhabdaceae bacterium]
MHCIYFDNPATSWPKPPCMIEAMIDFNNNIGANPGRSAHRLSIEAARVLFNTRDSIASLLGAKDPDTIVFTRNATEGLNIVIHGLLKPGDHVITTSMEHNSVMRPLRSKEKEGVELTIIKCSSDGEVDPEDISRAIKKNTTLIISTHASNVAGTIMPIDEIGHIARSRDIVYCVDGAQTVGNVAFNIKEQPIDILVFTGHKSLYGPQGTGGIYIRKGIEGRIKPLEQGGTGSRSEYEEHPDFMPDRFESGTPNTIGIAGLGASVRHVSALGIDNIRKKELHLTGLFLDGIASIEGIKVYGVKDINKKIAVVSFSIEGMTPSDISYILDREFNIMSRPGLHCAPSAHRTMGSFPEGTVRFGFGIFNTEEEIKIAIEAIEKIASGHKKKK